MNEPIEIPNKSSFKINEVCALTGVKSYVLRFWESEFCEIAPLLSSAGLKLYEHRDIESILLIKKLLFDDKLSIERAKAEMKILMPREQLVESSFSECEEEDLARDYLDQGSCGKPAHVSKTKRVLIESDLQKLVLAKSKLSEILSLTEALHQKNNWH
jgi:DNA-binding transcriptional MerR regulator